MNEDHYVCDQCLNPISGDDSFIYLPVEDKKFCCYKCLLEHDRGIWIPALEEKD